MTHPREFTTEFKAQIILEPLSAAKSSTEFYFEHQIASSVLADLSEVDTSYLRKVSLLGKNSDTSITNP